MSDERQETVADNVSVNHQFREVAKMIPHEEVDVSKMETTTPTSEKSSAAGNAAAMREALEKADAALSLISKSAWFIDANFAVTKAVIDARNAIEASLAELPRNCDVGTAWEQFQRFNMFCSPIKCRECKLYTEEDFHDCIFRWAQMPYEKGGAK